MFDRFIRMARARKALQEGRLEEAIQLADDPLIRADRRAEELRRKARDRLLQRVRERLAGGDHSAAARDLEPLAAHGNDAEVAACLADARRQAADHGNLRQAGLGALDEARRLAEHGQLDAAEAAAAPARLLPALGPALQAFEVFVAGRRERARHHLRQAEAHAQNGRVAPALLDLRAARALDRAASGGRWVEDLAREVVRRLSADVEPCLRAGEELAALQRYRARLAELPELADQRDTTNLGERLAEALLRRLAAEAEADTATDPTLLQACAAVPALPGNGARLQAAAQALLGLPSLRTRGRSGDLIAALTAAAGLLGSDRLAARARALAAQAQTTDARLEQARALAAAGDLAAARADLLAILEEWPMHEQARAELDAIDRGRREREQRLETARQAAKAGRLREAYGLALADAIPGPAGEDARLLAKDLRGRIDLVGRGLDQVRAAVHGRESASLEGLRHCLLRLEELEKVQSDHEELPALRGALTAEVEALDRITKGQAALQQRDFRGVAAAVGELVAARPQLLAADRLDARILDLADRLAAAAEEAVAGGRLAELDVCLGGLAAAAAVRADLGARAERMRAQAETRRQRAAVLAAEAEGLLAARDLTAAEQRCEAARQLWVDGPTARKVEDELRRIREQEAALARVEALTAGGDLAGAEQHLGDLPPTPPLLRTRIFDIKQSLARAQGLEGAFLLRVDEGGEHVVLRGESITIGNLRDGRADLPILAAIAGRHARIQRGMSFHGGMQDTIVAEGGVLRCGDQVVASHRLRPGDRVWLGTALQLLYSVPSARSLTATLRLLGGFQVAGTDRVLLFKDRGRDGRILLGAGADVHVRVPGATGEVEIFANKSGQIRVRSEAGGTIDGRPFKGEHPVDAGAAVQAAGIGFLLLPWRKGL